jgi:hypothetical protein
MKNEGNSLIGTGLRLDRHDTYFRPIAQVGTQQRITIDALVEKLASVCRNVFLFSESAVREQYYPIGIFFAGK